MKVLHVAETIKGGIATYLNELLPSQIEELGRDNVGVIVPRQHVDQLADSAAEIAVLFHRPSRALGVFCLALRSLVTILRFRPNIIHVHSTFAGVVVRSLTLLIPYRPTIIYCPHCWAMNREGSRLVQKLAALAERLLSYRTDYIIVLSEGEHMEGLQAGISASKLVLIESGITDLDHTCHPAPWVTPKLRVLFIGRLDRQKGPDILFRAAEGLRDRVSVRVVGENVIRWKMGVMPPDNVNFLGWMCQDSITEQLAACDVVAMPSRREGLSLVALETMRAGKALVATDISGLGSLVVNGTTGIVIPKDDPEALAHALMSQNAEQWSELGCSARKRYLSNYTSDRMRNEIMDLYGVTVHGIREVPVHREKDVHTPA